MLKRPFGLSKLIFFFGAAVPVWAAVTISVRLDQQYPDGSSSAQVCEPITVSQTSSTGTVVTASSGIIIKIPSNLGLTWDSSVTVARAVGTTGKLSGGASPAITYTDTTDGTRHRAKITVTSDFSDGEAVTIYGLKFASGGSGVGVTTSLDAVVSGGTATASQSVTINNSSITSTSAQSFLSTSTNPSAKELTLVDISGTATTTTNDLRIRIPSGFPVTWDTTRTPTITGVASAKVGAVSYPSSRICLIDITSDFSANDTIAINGLKFSDPTATSAADKLELLIEGSADTSADAFDRRLLLVTGPSMTMSLQSISAGASSASVNGIAITNVALNTSDDLRIAIPIESGLSWSASQSSASVSISGSGAITSAPTIEDDLSGNFKVLRFDVTTAVPTSSTVTVTGLKVDGGTSAETLELYLEASGPSQVDAIVTASSGGTITAEAGGSGGGEFLWSAGPVPLHVALGGTLVLVAAGALLWRRGCRKKAA